LLKILFILFFLIDNSRSDEILFNSFQDWNKWTLPSGIITVSTDGKIKPAFLRRHTNAIKNMTLFGGGIREAGTNIELAPTLLDGDPTTGWGPDIRDPMEDWYVDIDLGRGVFAKSISLYFDEKAEPFSLFELLLSTGEPQIDESNTTFNDILIFRTKKRFKENKSHKLVFDLDQHDHSPFRYLRIKNLLAVPGAKLTEITVEEFGDNVVLNLLEKSGQINIEIGNDDDEIPLGNAMQLADGNFFTRFRYGRNVRSPEDVWGKITLDLGATFWIDWIKIVSGIVPRPYSKSSGIIGAIGERALSLRRFDFNLYGISTSDGSISPDGNLIWKKKFLNRRSAQNYEQGYADHAFRLTPTRFIRIDWLTWDANCDGDCGAASGIIEELMVFGSGFPREVSFNSGIIDLGNIKNITQLNWVASTPTNTSVEIRTRSGNNLDLKITYFDKNGKEVTEKKYGKLIPSFRGKIDTAFSSGSDWSSWSRIYSPEERSFLSPAPRRYAEIEVRLTSEDPTRSAILDLISLDFSEPLGTIVQGEVQPSIVKPGVDTDFTYALRVESISSNFNRVILEGPTSLEFKKTTINEKIVGVISKVEPVDSTNDYAEGQRIVLDFPNPIKSNDLIKIEFSSKIFRQATRFEAFIENETSTQRVESGNADKNAGSDSDIVRLSVDAKVIDNVTFNTHHMTPNNDSINDELKIDIDVINVLTPRTLTLEIKTLTGKIIYDFSDEITAGEMHLFWDGRDSFQNKVPPGLYLAKISIDTDYPIQSQNRIISVIY
tara:strand:- start:4930 stop:7251 length:2322 start_codon:yes stop_codon:yes gene_type:complete